jgi:hypothetical protein
LRFEKKSVFTLFALGLLLTSLVFVQVAGQPGFAFIDPAMVYVNVCEDFIVTLVVDVTYAIQWFEVWIAFNATQMSLRSILVDPLWIETYRANGTDYVGLQGIVALGPVGPGPIPLAHLTFHCDGAGISEIEYTEVVVQDDGGTYHSDLQWESAVVRQYDFYWKPHGLVDYAPSGVPDFDQKQDLWTNPSTGQWSYCGPTAIANSFWWLDSFYEPAPLAPPAINDNFPLVWSYNPAVWDDHDPLNVDPLITDLAWYFDTDGQRTGILHNGTNVMDMSLGIDQYLIDHGLSDKFYRKTVPAPEFAYIVQEVEVCEDVTLLLGFWQFDGEWRRVGGHYVTVAGVDAQGLQIAFSDPFVDNAEAGRPGVVLPAPHGHPHDPRVHNDTLFVSHDIYAALVPAPGGSPGNQNFEVNYNEYEVDAWTDLITTTAGQNCPDEFQDLAGPYVPQLPVFTEVEYAVIVSCQTGLVAAGCEDTNVYVWDFFGNLQWQWAAGLPVVSVAMDTQGRFLAAGTRAEPDPDRWGDLWLFDNSLGGPPGNIVWMQPGINVSVSYDGGWMGTESKSVDVKHNSFNGMVVVAAATDQGTYLYNELGTLLWHYTDGWAETIVRISQDGNYLVCADHQTDVLHYFSHLADGVPGWSSLDGTPVWSFSGGDIHEFLHLFWVAISGLGDYVAVGGYDSLSHAGEVFLLNKTGGLVWRNALLKGLFVRVDMPCHGRSVVAVNDDPDDLVGCDLTYFSDGGNGWDSGDNVPVWSYWPGKEIGGGQTPTDDFYTVAIAENGDYVATGGVPPNTYLLDRAGVLQHTIPATQGHSTQTVDLTFTGRLGAAGDSFGVVWFFTNDTGLAWSRNTDWNAPIHSIAVSKIYPCMFPFPHHDLAITNVTPDKVSVPPGGTVSVNVTVTNVGDYTESFFDVYLEVLIGGLPQPTVIPLAVTVPFFFNDTATTETFTWDTTGLTEEKYLLVAKVSIVQEEIHVYDNTYIDGTVDIATPAAGHDVAVIHVTTSKTGCLPAPTVCQGYTANVSATVENQGNFTETFNVTAYANSFTIGKTQVTLNPDENTTVTFVWDTTSYAIANYTISVIADTVTGETEIADNTFVDGWVLVTTPGDVNGDGVIDIFDCVTIALAFGATPSDPGWNPNADINGDGVIDIFDLVIVALNFG